jgi:hypothetical protein
MESESSAENRAVYADAIPRWAHSVLEAVTSPRPHICFLVALFSRKRPAQSAPSGHRSLSSEKAFKLAGADEKLEPFREPGSAGLRFASGETFHRMHGDKVG